MKLEQHGSRLVLLAAALLFLVSAGCVERELYIKSDPPGALVNLNGHDYGVTPVAIPFGYYGDRFLELRLRGHQAEQWILPVHAPWYQVIPLDLFSELLYPGTLRDTHTYFFRLQPPAPADLAEKPAILDRAEKLRTDAFMSGEGDRIE